MKITVTVEGSLDIEIDPDTKLDNFGNDQSLLFDEITAGHLDYHDVMDALDTYVSDMDNWYEVIIQDEQGKSILFEW